MHIHLYHFCYVSDDIMWTLVVIDYLLFRLGLEPKWTEVACTID